MSIEIDERYMTPAMMALSHKRRLFVMAMASNPMGTHTEWAQAAGYLDNGSGGIRVRAYLAYHDPKVQAAVSEIAKAHLGVMGPLLAVHALLNLARDGEHSQHSKAVEMILNRTGMAEKQQIEVTHRDLTGDAVLERIRALAERHGLDADKLLGANASRETKVIEHKPAEDKAE